jgi:hypothetical protein
MKTETFEAHGHTWTKHTPGDPMPCESNLPVFVLLRQDKIEPTYDSPNEAGIWDWSVFRRDSSLTGWEIIGWRYADSTQEQPAKPAQDELATLREIVSACMEAMPCGNIATHTPENLAGRIGELAQALAAESLENEKLEAENARLKEQLSLQQFISRTMTDGLLRAVEMKDMAEGVAEAAQKGVGE